MGTDKSTRSTKKAPKGDGASTSASEPTSTVPQPQGNAFAASFTRNPLLDAAEGSDEEAQTYVQTETYLGWVSNSDLESGEATYKKLMKSLTSAESVLGSFAEALTDAEKGVGGFDSDAMWKAASKASEDARVVDTALCEPHDTDDHSFTVSVAADLDDEPDFFDEWEALETSYGELLDGVPDHLPAYDASFERTDELTGVTWLMLHAWATTPAVGTAKACVDDAAEMGSDEEAMDRVFRRLGRAGPELRSYLDAAVEHGAGDDQAALETLHDQLDMSGATIDFLEGDGVPQIVEMDEGGSKGRGALGDIIEIVGGRRGSETEVSLSINIPVYGVITVHGSGKLAVSNTGQGYKVGLELNAGLGVGKAGTGVIALRAGFAAEAKGSTGAGAARMLMVGLETSLRACKEEPPPFLADAMIQALGPAIATADGMYRLHDKWLGSGKGKSAIWSALAEASFQAGNYEELLQNMAEGDYVQTFDKVDVWGVGAIQEAIEGEGKVEYGLMRRVEKTDGEIRHADWDSFGTSSAVSGESSTLSGGASFETRSILDVRRGEPPKDASKLKFGFEAATSATGEAFEIGEAMFLGAITEFVGTVGDKTDDRPTEEALAELLDAKKQLYGTAQDAFTATMSGLPGFSAGVEVELEYNGGKREWELTVSIFAKSEAQISTVGKAAIKRKMQIYKGPIGGKGAAAA